LEGNENGLQKLWQSDWRTRPGRKADSREARIPLEQFQWPLGCAIGLLILEYLIPDKKRQQTVTKKNRQTRSAAAPVLTAPALCIAIAGLWLSSVSNAAAANGWELYQKQQYQQAGEAYKAGAKNNPEIPEWLFNAGAAAFKAGQYNEAVELFTQTLLKADPRLQQNAYYNLGNSRYRLGQQTEQTDPPKTISAWKSAVQDYENALKLVPEDADAKYNLELVKKKLEELQKKQQQNQNSAQNQDKQQQEQKNPDSKKNNKQNSSSGQNESNKNDAKDSSGKKNSKKDKDESPAREQPQNNENTGTLDKVDVSSGASQNPTEKKQPGQMGKEEANALLDAVKGDEKNLPIEILKSENAAQNRQDGKVRDW
jgi:Ca-activated chloride channel family protein